MDATTMFGRARRVSCAMAVTLATAGVMFWTGGCTEKDDPPEDPPYIEEHQGQPFDELIKSVADGENDQEGTEVTLVNVPDDPDFAGDPLPTTEKTYVGHGIHALSGPTYVEALKVRLFKEDLYTDKSSNGGSSYIDSDGIGTDNYESSVSKSLDSVYKSLDIKVSGETGKSVPWFSCKVDAQYGDKQTLESAAMFYKYEYRWEVNKHSFSADYKFASDLRPFLKDTVRSRIDGTMPYSSSELFGAYGTHIITTASVGGHVTVTGIYNDSKSISALDVKVAVNFKSNYGSGDGSTAFTENQKHAAEHTSITVKSQGGQLGMFAGVSIDALGEKMAAWGATVNIDNAKLGRIFDVIPIWEFASDADRRATLKKDFENLALGQKNLLDTLFGRSGLISNNNKYEIEGFSSPQKYMMVDGNSKETGTYSGSLIIWEPDNANTDNRKWETVANPAYPGYFYFKNGNSGFMIHPQNGIVDADRQLEQYTANANNAQLFRAVDNGDGSVSFLNYKDNEFKISRRGGQGVNGTRVVLNKGTGADTKWILHKQ